MLEIGQGSDRDCSASVDPVGKAEGVISQEMSSNFDLSRDAEVVSSSEAFYSSASKI